jgi:hypothetical protein
VATPKFPENDGHHGTSPDCIVNRGFYLAFSPEQQVCCISREYSRPLDRQLRLGPTSESISLIQLQAAMPHTFTDICAARLPENLRFTEWRGVHLPFNIVNYIN